jgi:dipeptidyl aminopeptidase/acylaminoacyl peptidase
VTEERLETVIILAGGAIDDNMPPQADPVNFAPRARIPVLMVNGKDDFIFPAETTGRMFELLGIRDKKQVFVDGGHAPARLEQVQVQAEILSWLDTHLGPVQPQR